jgi:hypothetical protein
MTATDYRQLHRCAMRCVSELRGIVHRLRERGVHEAAALIESHADRLNELIAALQPHRTNETTD